MELNPRVSSVQFSPSVVSDSLQPMNRSTPALPLHHQLWSSLKLMSIKSVMPSNHLSSLGSVIFSMLFPVWPTRPQPIKRERNKYHQVERFPRQDLEIEQVTYSHIPLAGTQLHGHISLQRKREKSPRCAQDDRPQPHSSV